MSAWTTIPTLTGRYVTLRALAAADQAALVIAASTDRLWDTFYASVSQLKDADAFMARAFAEQDQGRSLVFAVLDSAGEVAGTTRFMRINEPHRRLEIGGTFYATRVQRSGLNTEAKLLLLTHAFDTLGCQCVQLRTDRFNLRSQAAVERLGAQRDGVLRGHQVLPNGRLRDTVVYSIIDREWPGVRQNLDFLLARHP